MTEVEAQHVWEHLETPILAVAEVFDCEVIFEVHRLGVFPLSLIKSSSDDKLTAY